MSRDLGDTKYWGIGEAAKQINVSISTLHRWFRKGKVANVGRDRNGKRIFSKADIERISEYANRTDPPGKKDWKR